mmetsp:Transcript_27220/g.53011  ORF Transcript_27220/g.53011 Transcript_27220/m.53011 type:complete len:492 (-) Transcript_27220:472-1947(-)
MPPKRKHENVTEKALAAAKNGDWDAFENCIKGPGDSDDYNVIPQGRKWGIVHQIAYWGQESALHALSERFAQIDWKLTSVDGETPIDIARAEGHEDTPFFAALQERVRTQTHHEMANAAKTAEWPELYNFIDEGATAHMVTTVPPGRKYSVIHQVCYFGDDAVLTRLLEKFGPTLNLEAETAEEAPQTPLDIALGRGHAQFAQRLRELIQQAPANTQGNGAAGATESVLTATSAAKKLPVAAEQKLCRICYSEEHEPGTLGVECDENHFMCQGCFSDWVDSQSDIEANPQDILERGGRVNCVCKGAAECTSPAFANKLIAIVVADGVYEKYLRARDFVVGKEAVAGALAKVKKAGGMDAVEQEQIRNLYRKSDGTYSAYMCKQCHFGPVDHGWCTALNTHHGEAKGETGHVNNACPKCNWFAKSISAWPKWDGKFQTAGASSSSSAPAINVFALSVPELKAELKKYGAGVQGSKPVLQQRLQNMLHPGGAS